MAEWVLRVVVIVAIVWVISISLRPQYVFEIRIVNGTPEVRRGKVVSTFLDHIRSVCAEGGMSSGWIGGVRVGKRITLRFSRQFAPGPRQRLRNYWQLVG